MKGGYREKIAEAGGGGGAPLHKYNCCTSVHFWPPPQISIYFRGHGRGPCTNCSIALARLSVHRFGAPPTHWLDRRSQRSHDCPKVAAADSIDLHGCRLRKPTKLACINADETANLLALY